MEKYIDYVVISTQEYKDMIEDKINKENCIRELNSVKKEDAEIHRKLEKYFWNELNKNESYHLENIKECIPTDYHYQELYKCFLEIGITNNEYIHLSIVSLKHNFDNKRKENKNE